MEMVRVWHGYIRWRISTAQREREEDGLLRMDMIANYFWEYYHVKYDVWRFIQDILFWFGKLRSNRMKIWKMYLIPLLYGRLTSLLLE